jgi:hypothetical protein
MKRKKNFKIESDIACFIKIVPEYFLSIESNKNIPISEGLLEEDILIPFEMVLKVVEEVF